MSNPTFLQSDDLYGLWLDALVKDDDNQLLFLSAWGAESHVQQVRARFSLPVNDNGLRRFVVSSEQRGVWSFQSIKVSQPTLYHQWTGRPAQSRFAHLTHFWMAPQPATTPDKANNTALLLRRHSEDEARFEARIWQAAQAVCPIPLHPSWCGLLEDFRSEGWIQTYAGFGVDACRLTLPEKNVQPLVTEAVRAGRLQLPIAH